MFQSKDTDGDDALVCLRGVRRELADECLLRGLFGGNIVCEQCRRRRCALELVDASVHKIRFALPRRLYSCTFESSIGEERTLLSSGQQRIAGRKQADEEIPRRNDGVGMGGASQSEVLKMGEDASRHERRRSQLRPSGAADRPETATDQTTALSLSPTDAIEISDRGPGRVSALSCSSCLHF